MNDRLKNNRELLLHAAAIVTSPSRLTSGRGEKNSFSSDSPEANTGPVDRAEVGSNPSRRRGTNWLPLGSKTTVAIAEPSSIDAFQATNN
ncbi:MAG: hypothetical protein AB8B91_19450 [Rubripirellula sp.]